jgi:drug/metabolite transporter (DMT)-like permease
MDWKISVLLYVIVYSLSIILQKTLLKDDKKEVISRSVFFQLIAGAVLFIWALANKSLDFRFDWSSVWIYLISMTVLYGIGNAFIFKSLQLGSASSFSIYFSLRVFVNLVFAYFMFGQAFSIKSFIGLLGLLIGIVIVDYSSDIFKVSKAEILAMIAAVCVGSTNALSQSVLKTVNLNTFLFYAYLTPGLFMMMIKPRIIPNLQKCFVDKSLPKVILLALIQSASGVLFFYAIESSNDSSLVTAISLSSIVITIILEFWLLKERDHFWRKLIAAVITFGGLLLLI